MDEDDDVMQKGAFGGPLCFSSEFAVCTNDTGHWLGLIMRGPRDETIIFKCDPDAARVVIEQMEKALAKVESVRAKSMH